MWIAIDKNIAPDEYERVFLRIEDIKFIEYSSEDGELVVYMKDDVYFKFDKIMPSKVVELTSILNCPIISNLI